MSILHNVYQGFSSAVNLVVEKNRKNNLINRIKYVIREEETKANQAYIALGKYYFNHLRKEENEETEFYCKAVEHANNRIDRALTKLDELTIDAEDFFCDEDFESACEDLGFASCENAEEASSWDYTETINNEMIADKEISAEDTLNMRKLSKIFVMFTAAAVKIIKRNLLKVKLLPRKKIKFRLLKIIIFIHLETQKNNDFKIDRG